MTQVDPEKQQLAVSMRPGASDYTVGDEVNGKVPLPISHVFFLKQLSLSCKICILKKPGKKN